MFFAKNMYAREVSTRELFAREKLANEEMYAKVVAKERVETYIKDVLIRMDFSEVTARIRAENMFTFAFSHSLQFSALNVQRYDTK